MVFDADSTLAAIEGIDWLGAQRSANVANTIKQLTDRAMAGAIALEEVYAARLDVIKPTRDEIMALSAAYIAAIEPGAAQLLSELHAADVVVHVVSGGLRDALLPMAALLGIVPAQVHAVDITFDADGQYVSLAPSQMLSTQDGKPRLVRRLSLPRMSVMIGDGSTDAAVRGEVNAFFAYTAVARRPLVVTAADAEARSFPELRTLLFELENS